MKSSSRKSIKGKSILVALGLLFGSVLGFNLLFSYEAFGSSEDQLIVVQSGDTLWSIASANYKGKNPQEAIYYIKQANHLSTPDLEVGMELRLPNF